MALRTSKPQAGHFNTSVQCWLDTAIVAQEWMLYFPKITLNELKGTETMIQRSVIDLLGIRSLHIASAVHLDR